jgi:PBP1b-binding outer membrane lipoprotein LpoB
LILKKIIFITILTWLFTGCATFTPNPLTNKRISKAMEFSIIKFKNPITPEKAAFYAVKNNPQLKVERAKRNVKKAQLIELGLLPNPELSTDIQYPSGGNKAGTTNDYDIGFHQEFFDHLYNYEL